MYKNLMSWLIVLSFYQGFDVCGAMVTAVIVDNTIVTEVAENDRVAVILDNSHFYSESGGQIGDKGIIRTKVAKSFIRPS